MTNQIKSTCCYCGVGCGILIETICEHGPESQETLSCGTFCGSCVTELKKMASAVLTA